MLVETFKEEAAFDNRRDEPNDFVSSPSSEVIILQMKRNVPQIKI
jgi:hypothetical protein